MADFKTYADIYGDVCRAMVAIYVALSVLLPDKFGKQ